MAVVTTEGTAKIWRPTDLRLVLNRAVVIRTWFDCPARSQGTAAGARERTGTVFNTAVHVVLGRFLGDHERPLARLAIAESDRGLPTERLTWCVLLSASLSRGRSALTCCFGQWILNRYDRDRSAHEGMAHTKSTCSHPYR